MQLNEEGLWLSADVFALAVKTAGSFEKYN